MKAIDRIRSRQNNILFRKEGKRYIPANDVWALDGLSEGWWLIKVESGSKTIRSIVYPEKAELLAAARDKEEELIKIIRQASEAKPKEGVPMSEELHNDWKALVAKHGDELSAIYFPSFQENAEKIVAALLTK